MVQEQIGTAFDIADDVAHGVLGVLCAGLSPYEAFDELCDVLDFVSDQVIHSPNTHNKRVGNTSDFAADTTAFERIKMTINYLAGKLKDCARIVEGS